ncbi:MAG TPA: hypothetical protein VD997_07705 [Phycisphaerales bacterium]|nr:hypothetical protein [Phycisphaerales bacterium]
MNAPKQLVVVACLIILIGGGWLLSGLGLMPDVNWIWVGGLMLAGLLTIALGGFDKLTLTIGPWLIVAGIGAFLREGGYVSSKVEIPALVLAFGVLMLLNLVLPVPGPRWAKNGK